MKRIFLFQAIFLFLLASAQAQTTIHSGASPSSSQPNRRPAAQTSPDFHRVANNLNQEMKYRPRPAPVRFMTWRSKTSMASIQQQQNAVPAFTGSKLPNNANPNSRRGSATYSTRPEIIKAMMNPTITKNTANGHHTTYELTTDVGSWRNKTDFSPRIAPLDKPHDDGSWTCTASTISVNARSTSFMNPHPDQQGSFLIPGMVYAFDEYSAGNFNQHYNVNRNPVTLVSDVLNSPTPVSADVSDPNMRNLSTGIQSIVSHYAPAQGGSDYQIQATLTDNNSDQDIFVSAGGSYGAFEGSASLHHTQNDHHIYYTIDAVKTMFTINVQPPANGIFINAATPTSNSPLLMLQSVSYGARVLANMDIELKSTSDLGKLHLSYNDGMESARADMEALFANQSVNVTINGYLIGFPTHFPGSFTATKDNFFKLMDQFFSGCDYGTCKPIQYSMVNMDGDQVGIYSATDNFTVQECNPSNETFTLQSVMAVVQSGDDAKNSNSEFWLTIGAGDAQHIHWTGQFYDNHSEFKRDGNPYQIPIPLNYSGYRDVDFNSGGMVALKLIEHGHSGDDWDISDLKLIFNFVSQKGTQQVRTLDIPNFKLHDTKNSQQDSKQIFFQTYSPEKFVITGQ